MGLSLSSLGSSLLSTLLNAQNTGGTESSPTGGTTTAAASGDTSSSAPAATPVDAPATIADFSASGTTADAPAASGDGASDAAEQGAASSRSVASGGVSAGRSTATEDPAASGTPEVADSEDAERARALRLQDDLQAASIVHTLEKAATQRREAEMAHAKALEGYRESARASAA